MGTKAALKAKWRLTMPNLFAPQRATRRFRWFMDDTFKLSDPDHLEKRLEKYVGNTEEESGETEELIDGFKKFQKEVIVLIGRDEKAEWGMIFESEEEVQKIKKGFKNIENELTKDKKKLEEQVNKLTRLNNIETNAHEEIAKEVNEEIKRIQQVFLTKLDELQKRELLISRSREQLRGMQFKTDSAIKSELNSDPFKIKEEDKERDKFLKKLMDDIKHKDKKLIEADLKELLKIITESMNLIFEEMADLIELILNILKSLSIVYEKHVEEKLFNQRDLPKRYFLEIEKIFKEIEDHVKNDAEIDFEAIKIVMQETQSIN